MPSGSVLTGYSLQELRVPRFAIEITTVVGCSVHCAYCPQKSLLSRYRSSRRRLEFEDFCTALEKMPKDVIIIFAGFAEPFLHPRCTEMILWAHHRGHPVCVFTTAVGLRLADVARLRDLPYSAFPHGGFTLHLPDARGLAHIPITPNYLEVLAALKEARIQNFAAMAMDAVHPAVASLFPPESVSVPVMNSRSGNLTREGVDEAHRTAAHEGAVICGRDEYIYNNVMLPNGDIVLCCQDYHLDHVLGNILEQPFAEVLPSPLHSYELCRSCVHAIQLPPNFPVFSLRRPGS